MLEEVQGLVEGQALAGAFGLLHCSVRGDQPVTIVALLATQEAARPTITNRVTDIAPLSRLQ
ncbi:hypothetical protein [Streptomyces sp. C184]|uniref:hypothetical protein n=1 Tax=Streptomyces sp. C184 TaxID=3237121 RepID=UPI0034C5D420